MVKEALIYGVFQCSTWIKKKNQRRDKKPQVLKGTKLQAFFLRGLAPPAVRLLAAHPSFSGSLKKKKDMSYGMYSHS